jgi:hypothetical protein
LKKHASRALEAPTYNTSYSGGRGQEDHSSKPAQANSSPDPISEKKTHHTKGEGGLVEWLKVQALSSNPSTGRKKNKFKMHFFQEGPSNELPPTLITSLQVLSSWTTSILYSNSIF